MQNLPVNKQVLDHFITNNVLVLLAAAAVALRLVARRIKAISLGADDYLIIAAMPLAVGMLTVQGLYARLGAGYQITEVPVENLITILQLLIAYQLIFAMVSLAVKLSILFFYLRIFVTGGLRLTVKIIMGITLAWSGANIIQVFLICRPFRYPWDITVPGACGNRQGSFIAIGSFNIVTDFVILLLPVPTVWGLHMTRSAKIALTFVFTVGLLVSAVAILRMTTLAQINFDNLTGTMVYPSFWSTTEPILSILSVCLPMLHPILVYLFPSRFRNRAAPTGDTPYPSKRTAQSFSTVERLPEDAYSLSQLCMGRKGAHHEANVHTSYSVAAPATDSSNTLSGRPHSGDSDELFRGNGIPIQKEFDVKHTS